jgi:hypothetical protein
MHHISQPTEKYADLNNRKWRLVKMAKEHSLVNSYANTDSS